MDKLDPTNNDVIKTAKMIVRWFTSTNTRCVLWACVPDFVKSLGWCYFFGVIFSIMVLRINHINGFDAVVFTGGCTAIVFRLGRAVVTAFRTIHTWAYQD